ncbi:MAG: LysE family translocator [Burkholderiales bacterium]|nr:LysE family translocator [Burkholderiales bacterium]
MFGVTDWWMFLSTALIINATPGTDVLFVFTNYCNYGKSAAIKCSVGLILGYLVYVILTFIGLTVLLTQYPTLTNVIKIVGGIYLIYLGISTLLNKNNKLETNIDVNKSTKGNMIIKGFLVSALNPKVGLFFLSFLPQFISGNNGLGILVLGIIFCIGATFFNLLYCLTFSQIAKGNRYKLIMTISSIILIILGIIVIFK